MLKKEQILHQRDTDGKLRPIKVKLELLEGEPDIRAIPMPRGELRKFFNEMEAAGQTDTTKDQNDEIIRKYLVEPELTEQEIKDMKPIPTNAISVAIFSISTGISQKEIEEKSKKAMLKKVEETTNKKAEGIVNQEQLKK